MFRPAVIRQLKTSVRLTVARKGSDVARPPLPPPSPIKNFGEYIEPSILHGEHPIPQYRQMTKPSKRAEIVATIFGTVMWTWILFGLWYEHEHVTGSNFPWPDAKSWTDKELGIPDQLADPPEVAE